MGKLTKSAIDKLLNQPQEKQLQLPDGNNLYLFVTSIGSCKFKYRIFLNSKASWITIGDYPAISLDQARQEALKTRSMIKNGINPVAEKQKQKEKKITLAQFSEIYFAERLPIVRTTPASMANFKRVISNNVLPIIGKQYLTDVDENSIKKVIITNILMIFVIYIIMVTIEKTCFFWDFIFWKMDFGHFKNVHFSFSENRFEKKNCKKNKK